MTAFNFLKEPWERQTLDETIASQKARGEDIASNLTADFVSLQFRLIPYRIKRAGTEVSAIIANPFGFLLSWDCLITLVIAYLSYKVAYHCGTESLYPLAPPPAKC